MVQARLLPTIPPLPFLAKKGFSPPAPPSAAWEKTVFFEKDACGWDCGKAERLLRVIATTLLPAGKNVARTHGLALPDML